MITCLPTCWKTFFIFGYRNPVKPHRELQPLEIRLASLVTQPSLVGARVSFRVLRRGTAQPFASHANTRHRQSIKQSSEGTEQHEQEVTGERHRQWSTLDSSSSIYQIPNTEHMAYTGYSTVLSAQARGRNQGEGFLGCPER